MITKRVDAITHIDKAHKDTIIPAPKSVKIELTAKCNFRCTFCASEQRLRTKGDMDFGFFQRITKEMSEIGVKELGVFYLGESFLSSNLIKAIHYAKNVAKFPYVFLTTNGSVAFGNRVKECMNAGLDSLKFSLNYASPEQFEQIARVKGPLYYRILDNMRAARIVRDEVLDATGHNCGLYASYIKYDEEQDEKMQQIVDEAKQHVDEIYALPLYNQAALVPNAKAVAGNLGRYDNMREPIPCWSIFTEGHITWDGKLSACCFDHDGRFEMGDLTKQSFMECWNSTKFRELRQAHLDGCVDGTVCEKCIAWK